MSPSAGFGQAESAGSGSSTARSWVRWVQSPAIFDESICWVRPCRVRRFGFVDRPNPAPTPPQLRHTFFFQLFGLKDLSAPWQRRRVTRWPKSAAKAKIKGRDKTTKSMDMEQLVKLEKCRPKMEQLMKLKKCRPKRWFGLKMLEICTPIM